MINMRKSVSSRIKITKTGKILRRKMAQDHFRAKKSGKQLNRKKGTVALEGQMRKAILSYLN